MVSCTRLLAREGVVRTHHHRVHAELHAAHLEAHPRTQGRLHEDESRRSALEPGPRRSGAVGHIQNVEDLVRREFGEREKVATLEGMHQAAPRTVCSASPSIAVSSELHTSGGRKRRMRITDARSARYPARGRQPRHRCARGSASSTAIISPRPRTSAMAPVVSAKCLQRSPGGPSPVAIAFPPKSFALERAKRGERSGAR